MSVQVVPEEELLVVPKEDDLKKLEEDEEPEETFGERLWGLTEMFPDWLRTFSSAVTYGSVDGIKALYNNGRGFFWIVFSSSAVLFAPVIFEIERAQMEDMQRQQNRQIILGPNAALTGQGNFPLAPPLPRS
ncbi:hypothetical protein CHUAL_011746 [Chamberlinius hualienensis]